MFRIAAATALAVFSCLAPRACLSNGLDDFLAFNASTKTATGTFEQQAFDRTGKVVDHSSGTLAFARPGKFRWVYEKPHKQVLVADGTRLWIYDPDLAQVTVKRIDQAISSTPAALLAGRDDITRLFTLRDAGTKDGLDWVEAQPKAQDTGFDRVRLGLKGRTLAAMELYDQAVQIVLQNKRASISLVQRHLRIGYNRAARLIEDMERAGLVSAMASNGNREILVPAREK